MTDIRNDIERIILAGAAAPSGDNLQPWRFEVFGNNINVFSVFSYDPESVLSNSKQALNIAHGALLENMLIAAQYFGYTAEVHLFPDRDDPSHTIQIVLSHTPGLTKDAALYESISHRTTERSSYSMQSLTNEQKELFYSVPKELGIQNANVRFIEEKGLVQALANLVMTQVKILFSYRKLHREFYASLRWNIQQAYEMRDGLDVPSLRLNFMKRALFRYVLSSWLFVKVGTFFCLNYIAAFFESLRYAHSSAYCAIVSNGDTDIDAINGGRILERLWLVATQESLSMQPTSATLLLQGELDRGLLQCTNRQKKLLSDAAKKIYHIFSTEEGHTIQHMFRVGYSSAIPHKSLRKYPEITELIS